MYSPSGINNHSLLLVLITLIMAYNLNLSLSSPPPPPSPSSSLKAALRRLNGNSLSFTNISYAATDYGNIIHNAPLAVLYPASVDQIARTVELASLLKPFTELTIAAAGNRHSNGGQGQAKNGIVVDMGLSSLYETQVFPKENPPYVEAWGGAMWITVLNKTLEYGLAPRSWTDYLHISVGGTLSNAGISGQAFRYGPQISNVLRLEVVTGVGEIVNCSATENEDLFYAVLGGLGQFGIITKARIILEPAPQKVKQIKAFYTNFTDFTRDQEFLITSEKTFDYIEGMVLKNKSEAPQFRLEVNKNFNDNDDPSKVKADIDGLLSNLSYIPSTLSITESSYVDFLERVYSAELFLDSIGLWQGGDVAHPWQNLLMPKKDIHTFASQAFYNLITDSSLGPIIVYPLNKSKWDNRTSVVLPEGDDEIFYAVSILPRANISSNGTDGLQNMLNQRKKISDFCESASIGAKQYLPYYETPAEWQTKQYGPQRWKVLAQRKETYDPSCVLAPGQNIFTTANCPGAGAGGFN